MGSSLGFKRMPLLEKLLESISHRNVPKNLPQCPMEHSEDSLQEEEKMWNNSRLLRTDQKT